MSSPAEAADTPEKLRRALHLALLAASKGLHAMKERGGSFVHPEVPGVMIPFATEDLANDFARLSAKLLQLCGLEVSEAPCIRAPNVTGIKMYSAMLTIKIDGADYTGQPIMKRAPVAILTEQGRVDFPETTALDAPS